MSGATEAPIPLSLEDHTVRLLPAEEWSKLDSIMADSFPDPLQIPPPPLSHAIVIEKDGDVKFAMFFRQEFHMEPVCARKGYGHFFPHMVALLEQTIREKVLAPGGELYYYCTAPNTPEQIAREERLDRAVMKDHVPVIGVVRRPA